MEINNIFYYLYSFSFDSFVKHFLSKSSLIIINIINELHNTVKNFLNILLVKFISAISQIAQQKVISIYYYIDELYSLFSPFCSILSIELFYDNITRKSLCYGYIIITSDSDVLISHSFSLKGNKLSLRESTDRTKIKRSRYSQIKQSRKIFVGGLPPETTKISLSHFFERYGDVEYSIVITDKHTNRPRGFGFVIFKNINSVENALSDSWNHFINGKWVECKKANSKEQCKEGRVESEGETNESSNDSNYSTLSNDIVINSMPFTRKSKPLDNFVYVNSDNENNKYVQTQMENYYRFKFSFDTLSH